jgi:hypothetical protein
VGSGLAAFSHEASIADDWLSGYRGAVRRLSSHAILHHSFEMLMVAYIFLAGTMAVEAAEAPMKAPVVVPVPISGPIQDIPEAPPFQTVSDIERLRRARPWRFGPNGELRSPAIELAKLSCIKSAFRHFACRYDIRVREFGETEFGPWLARQKVFTKLGTDWVMFNAEEHCSEINLERLPDYCFPKDPGNLLPH